MTTDDTAARDRMSLRALSLSDPRRFRLMMSAYPPLLFAGVRVVAVAHDWTSVRVAHQVRPWNRNIYGSAFGGTLFALTDPFYAVMAMAQLGPGHRIWNSAADIEFLRPGRGLLTAHMALSLVECDDIRTTLAVEGRSRTRHQTEIRCAEGAILARASQVLHVSTV
ncbi:DUF4442 domain-containing protein [Nocardia takedensis]|uniref:DUF4442 domain-containing protein n=1 Tax=Nocardia takedensis TaxID=259390 RepID=UPI003F76FA74